MQIAKLTIHTRFTVFSRFGPVLAMKCMQYDFWIMQSTDCHHDRVIPCSNSRRSIMGPNDDEEAEVWSRTIGLAGYGRDRIGGPAPFRIAPSPSERGSSIVDRFRRHPCMHAWSVSVGWSVGSQSQKPLSVSVGRRRGRHDRRRHRLCLSVGIFLRSRPGKLLYGVHIISKFKE